MPKANAQDTPRPDRRTAAERGEHVRQALLAAAVQLIPERGWHDVSTRLVAERAGVAAGLVHYHFPSLQALLRQAAVGVMEGVLAETVPLLSRARTPASGLKRLLAALDDYSGTDATSLLAVETYLAATRDDDLRAELGRLLDELRDAFTAWLTQHEVPAARATASVLAATLDGLMLHRALNPGLTSATVAPVLRRLLAVDPHPLARTDSPRRVGTT